MARFNPLQNSFTSGVITSRLAVRNDLQQINSGLRQGFNGIVLPQGGYMKRPGTIFVAEAKNRNAPTALIKFDTSIQQEYVMEWGKDSAGVGYTRFFANGGVVVDPMVPANPLELANVFDDPQGVRVAQNADVMWVVHPNKYPYKLSRTAFDAFNFTKGPWINAPNAPCRPTNVATTTLAFDSGTGIITATDPVFSLTNDVNRAVKFDDVNYLNITSVIDTTHANAVYVLGGGSGATISATINWALGLFSDTEGCRAVTFHQGRLWFGGAPSVPDWVVGSVSDDFPNFDRGTTTGSTPTSGDDDRSIGKRLVSEQINSIYWIKGFGQILIIGCSGAEFRLFGSVNDLLTPTGTIVRAATNTGSAYTPALVIDNTAVFVQYSRRGMYELKYDILRDQISVKDLFLFSEDAYDALFSAGKGCQRTTYQQVPDKVVWSVHGDGHIVSLTYDPDQAVYGVSNHSLGGLAIDVCAIQNVAQNADTPWFVADYTVGGVQRRYVTYMADYYRPVGINRKSTIADKIAALNTAYFVDCGLDTTFMTNQTTVSGLSYLEGLSVAVLLDGTVHPNVTVSGGAITTTRAGKHFVVGLPYSYFAETERFTGGGKLGTDIGQKTQIPRMAIVVKDTVGGRIGRGPNPANTEPLTFRAGGSVLGQSPPLTSGEFDLTIDGKWDDDVTIYWDNVQPLPMTVLAIAPRGKVGER